MIQGHVSARAWRFKSSLRHHSFSANKNQVMKVDLTLDSAFWSKLKEIGGRNSSSASALTGKGHEICIFYSKYAWDESIRPLEVKYKIHLVFYFNRKESSKKTIKWGKNEIQTKGSFRNSNITDLPISS